MKVAIIGGGAVGLLFAAMLKKIFDITILTRTKEQAEEIHKFGLLYGRGEKEEVYFVHVKQLDELTSLEYNQFDLIIFACKQYQLPDLAVKVANHQGQTLLFLQNGMGHVELLSHFSADSIIVGSVEHGAIRVTSRHVWHTGVGRTRLAVVRPSPKADAVIQHLLNIGIQDFPFILEENYLGMLSDKLLVNAVINPLTTMLRITNGELLENSFFNELFIKVCSEVARVLEIPREDALVHVTNVCNMTARNESSMLKDIKASRPTEIDAIVGYVLDEAKRKKIEVPLTEMCYLTIKGLEQQGGGN